MSTNFRDLFPTLQPALEGVARIPFVHQINETLWIFAAIETGHLLFLTTLGGAVLILNLRILGLILNDVPVEEVERAARPWYQASVAGAVITGVVMGITSASTLLPNGAFFIKMVALLAAIMLSHMVAKQVRSLRPIELRNAKFIISAGFAVWLFALFLFATTARVNPGSILIALAGAALLTLVTQRQHRPAILAVSAIALGGWYVSLNTLAGDVHGGSIALTGTGIVAAAVIAPAIGSGVKDVRTHTIRTDSVRKLTAFASTLAWITVAAAGRWIGFS